jgi:hypothetical protein
VVGRWRPTPLDVATLGINARLVVGFPLASQITSLVPTACSPLPSAAPLPIPTAAKTYPEPSISPAVFRRHGVPIRIRGP